MFRLFLAAAGLMLVPASTAVPAIHVPREAGEAELLDGISVDCSQPVDKEWIQKVNRIRWVAYSSPKPNSEEGFYQPTSEAIYQDLLALKKANFTGLITYGSAGIMGRQFLEIAQSLGYKGIIMGIWDPGNQAELSNARNASDLPIVLGYTIGNEGLSDSPPRYSIPELCPAISDLRASTGKPVTTSEDIETYYRLPQLLSVGDWVFAISHPYWHFTKFPLDAIRWEQEQYSELLKRTDHFVFFKEVGLPTEGAYGLSEANQDLYYRGLAETEVRFAYFEGFDQPSKTTASVEPHWGLFHSDLTPKLLGWNLMGYRVFTSNGASNSQVLECSKRNDDDCSIYSTATLLLVGDGAQDRQYISFVSFNTAGLPDNAIVTSVKLRVKSAGIAGANPLNNHQDLVLDICPPLVQGNAKTQKVECKNVVGIFDENPNSGWYTVNLDPAAFETINPAGWTRFRLRVNGAMNNNVSRAYIKFYNGGAVESNQPILIVRYYLP